MPVKPPFSIRVSGPKAWVQSEWPKTARMALLHLLHDLVVRQFVNGWVDIDRELRRIAREEPTTYEGDAVSEQARRSARTILDNLEWERLFDFCERLYSKLSADVTIWDGFRQSEEVVVPRSDVQQFIAEELGRIFLEEHLAYSFEKGEVRRRSKSHTRELMVKAEPYMGDSRLEGARQHYAKARQYFQDPTKPDFENVVKEAVCAVEAAARSLFPSANAKTLDDVVKRIQGNGEGQLPKPLATTLTGLYAYRGAGVGVSHGGADGGKVTAAIAEYVLGVAAAQVVLLCEISRLADEIEVPF